MSDVWVVLIVITVFIISRELFIWLVHKIIVWIRLLKSIFTPRKKEYCLYCKDVVLVYDAKVKGTYHYQCPSCHRHFIKIEGGYIKQRWGYSLDKKSRHNVLKESLQNFLSWIVKHVNAKKPVQPPSYDTAVETTSTSIDKALHKPEYIQYDSKNPIDNTALYEKIEKMVMEPQHKDAKMRLERPNYWLDTGYWVSLAIIRIEYAIHDVSIKRNPDPEAWLNKVIRQVEIARDKFRKENEDPDGVGIATFHEVVRALDDLVGKTNQIVLEYHSDDDKEEGNI